LFTEESGQGKPVYRLTSGGRYLFTDSAIERDSAVQKYGYRLEGVAFNGVDQSVNPNAARAVYRLVNNNNGTYLYTISTYERDNWINMGYRYEGVSFYLEENSGATTVQTYRLAHPNGAYVLTQSQSERDNAVQYYGYRYEGVAFNSINQLTPVTVPVYRLAGSGGYLYTTNFSERISATRIGYRDEGVAMYTYGVASDPNLNSVYRLSRLGSYLYTTSSAERDQATQKYGYKL
jgi:hypothetical protein